MLNINSNSLGIYSSSKRICILIVFHSDLKEENVWACLAAMATYAKDLNTAEVAYAAIKEVCDFLMLSFYHSNILSLK